MQGYFINIVPLILTFSYFTISRSASRSQQQSQPATPIPPPDLPTDDLLPSEGTKQFLFPYFHSITRMSCNNPWNIVSHFEFHINIRVERKVKTFQ